MSAETRGNEDDGVSIVIPAYNEEGAIQETLDYLQSVMDKHSLPYELVVVNDGSTDRTGDLLAEYSGKNEDGAAHITVLQHFYNRGYGAALKTGISKAFYNHICITDADGTYPIDRIPDLFGKYREKKADMVVGQRPFNKLPLVTRPAKWAITRLASYLAERKIPDINSGLRIFNRAIAQRFFNIISDGFSFTTTITLSMMTNGYSVLYYPIDYYKRKGKSKINPVKDTLNFIILIIRTVMYFNPLKVFLPISLFLFFAALAVFLVGYFAFHVLYDSTVAILVVGSVQVLTAGMIADVIDKRVGK